MFIYKCACVYVYTIEEGTRIAREDGGIRGIIIIIAIIGEDGGRDP